jgi:hypothetical protein
MVKNIGNNPKVIREDLFIGFRYISRAITDFEVKRYFYERRNYHDQLHIFS